jgi:hypothetical protein
MRQEQPATCRCAGALAYDATGKQGRTTRRVGCLLSSVSLVRPQNWSQGPVGGGFDSRNWRRRVALRVSYEGVWWLRRPVAAVDQREMPRVPDSRSRPRPLSTGSGWVRVVVDLAHDI